MRVIYHPEAERELTEAGAFYESRVPGLGVQFLNSVDLAVLTLQAAPTCYRLTDGSVRRFPLRRFPYGIYYRIMSEHIRILAVKHHSRHPDYWQDRLTD